MRLGDSGLLMVFGVVLHRGGDRTMIMDSVRERLAGVPSGNGFNEQPAND